MKKIKLIILTSFLLLFILPINITAETNFPVNEAGISAYVKIDDVGDDFITKLTESLNYYEDVITNETSHVIGTVKIEILINPLLNDNQLPLKEYTNPYVYLDLNGWMVAYFPKDYPASKIMQWTDYSSGTINSTILENAINEMTKKLGLNYSSPVKYYHFQYPEANKMTIVAETAEHPNRKDNNFSVVIPGDIYEASYSFYYVLYRDHAFLTCNIYLKVDGKKEANRVEDSRDCHGRKLEHGLYSPAAFEKNRPHLVSLSLQGSSFLSFKAGAATIFIYKI